MTFRSLVITVLLLCSCSMVVSPPPPTVSSTATPIPLLSPTSTDTWQRLALGLEQRTFYPPPQNEVTKLVALRIDSADYTFRVHYRPGAPLTIRQWAAELPEAVAFVNANFFDQNGNILGLLVSDGQIYGRSYTNQGGTFLVQNGQPRIRSNIAEPYSGEPLEQAVQAFPMLMVDGKQAYAETRKDQFTRRTIIAQDRTGRIVLLVTPLIGLTLVDLSTFLPTTDMNLVNALNLDGGGSTMMYLNIADTPQYVVTSLDPVPAVLAVYRRP